MNTLIKGLQKNGYTIWFVDNDTFYIMNHTTTIIYATVKKGTGRKVLLNMTYWNDSDMWFECKGQKDCLDNFLSSEYK